MSTLATLLAVLVLLVAGACSGVVPEVGGVRSLVTVEQHGGMCADLGECRSSTNLNSDGTVTGDAKPPNIMGTMTPGVLAQLQAAIAQTDFGALDDKPFTGTCPTAVDGQEIVFTFHLPGGDVRLASCEVELDPEAPIFKAVLQAMQAGVGPSN
jgi:hypothetical protein